HMHQPYYKNTETNKFILPWVRLHGVKDYYDMVAILRNYPNIKQNFNLVPSLLLQIEEYINGVTDIFWDLSIKRPQDLDEDERVFILYNFFMANWETMVKPYPRYSFLLSKRGKNTTPDEIKKIHKKFSDAEIRDLQVWFNLTWIDKDFFIIFPELKTIFEKGENFSEEEKNFVLESHLKILKLIIPEYKNAWNDGRIELSTSPFYHPILPLIYNTDIAKQCMPGIKLDFNFSYPEDAESQIKKACNYFIEKFGRQPSGIWPSEGSVSMDVVKIFAKSGFKWFATDEEILKETLLKDGQKLNADTIYKPYKLNTEYGEIQCIFRNHFLSDLIGFTYHSWNSDEASDNFIYELYKIKNSLDDNLSCVNIILDGENAWEYYENDGKDFLHSLYRKLSNNSDFKLVTVNEALNYIQDKKELKNIFPGSWINKDFYIWIGHEQDKKAWKLLKKAREDFVEWQKMNIHETEKIKKAWESIYIAEGSDWNWWYGDDHSSKNDTEFDNLYRLHLMNVYKIIGLDVPPVFYEPIQKGPQAFEMLPTRFITPVIDGYDTSYFEWRGAGIYDLKKEDVSMHQTDKFIEKVYYGFNLEYFYLRFDINFSALRLIDQKFSLLIRFFDGEKKEFIKINISDNNIESSDIDITNIFFSVKNIIEISIPFNNVSHLMAGKEVKCSVFVLKDDKEIQRIPEKGILRIQMPDRDFFLYNWKV
ncbi:MAG: glycoside hydrolase family 57 protein, partial [Candidatus Goldbacteria bacterium]|nr:glycoside hydrolase family 57 protein [Candidatus Goldiibacteriota bacterium]